MTKKIRLIDEEPSTPDTAQTVTVQESIDNEKLMGFLEAIDWKLWEMLKLMKAQNEDKNED